MITDLGRWKALFLPSLQSSSPPPAQGPAVGKGDMVCSIPPLLPLPYPPLSRTVEGETEWKKVPDAVIHLPPLCDWFPRAGTSLRDGSAVIWSPIEVSAKIWVSSMGYLLKFFDFCSDVIPTASWWWLSRLPCWVVLPKCLAWLAWVVSLSFRVVMNDGGHTGPQEGPLSLALILHRSSHSSSLGEKQETCLLLPMTSYMNPPNSKKHTPSPPRSHPSCFTQHAGHWVWWVVRCWSLPPKICIVSSDTSSWSFLFHSFKSASLSPRTTIHSNLLPGWQILFGSSHSMNSFIHIYVCVYADILWTCVWCIDIWHIYKLHTAHRVHISC